MPERGEGENEKPKESASPSNQSCVRIAPGNSGLENKRKKKGVDEGR